MHYSYDEFIQAFVFQLFTLDKPSKNDESTVSHTEEEHHNIKPFYFAHIFIFLSLIKLDPPAPPSLFG